MSDLPYELKKSLEKEINDLQAAWTNEEAILADTDKVWRAAQKLHDTTNKLLRTYDPDKGKGWGWTQFGDKTGEMQEFVAGSRGKVLELCRRLKSAFRAILLFDTEDGTVDMQRSHIYTAYTKLAPVEEANKYYKKYGDGEGSLGSGTVSGATKSFTQTETAIGLMDGWLAHNKGSPPPPPPGKPKPAPAPSLPAAPAPPPAAQQAVIRQTTDKITQVLNSPTLAAPTVPLSPAESAIVSVVQSLRSSIPSGFSGTPGQSGQAVYFGDVLVYL